MAHLQYLDELIKEYLIFRGFTSTLRAFDNDLKNDKDKSFRVDRITNQIQNYIQTYDLNGLRDLWSHLDRRLFHHLSPSLLPRVKKLETCILRLYVINTVQTSKTEKLHEFFDKMAPELQNHSEWKEWFVLPYLKSVEDVSTFSMYFTRQWQDTLFVSFQNFLAIVFQNMKLPTLANYVDESNKITKLQEENDLLRSRLKALTASDPTFESTFNEESFTPRILRDDFSHIPQGPPNSENQIKSFKSLLGLGGSGGTSPPFNPQHKVQSSSQSNSQSRRSSSQAPSEDRRKPRSSSLASASRTSEHAPVKRVAYGSSAGSHMSRSPTKGQHLPQDAKGQGSKTPADSTAPFLLVTREHYTDHRAIVCHTAFNQSGTLVASADMDGVIKLWSPYPVHKTEDTLVMKGAITALEWLPCTDKMLLIASKIGSLRLYDSQDKRTVWDILPETCPTLRESRIMCVKSLPYKSSFVVSSAPRGNTSHQPYSSSNSPSIQVFDFKSQKLESFLKLDASIANTCVPNHNGGLLLCGCNDGAIRILDLRSGDVVVSWSAHQGEVFTVKLSPQEDKIYSLGKDNRFASWSLAQTGSRIMESTLHEKAAGPFMVDVAGGKAENSLLRPYGSLFSLLQDDQHLFTCSASGPIVYSIKDNSLQQVMSLKGHTAPVITLDCCSAHQFISCVSSSLDGKVSLASLLPK